MQDELCKCGNPVWLCRSGSGSFRFKIETVVCQADRAMREYDDLQLPTKEREKDVKVKNGWGVIKFAKPELFDKSLTLPTRADYMKEFA